MVDIECKNSTKKSKGINLLNHLFKKRGKRNLNEMIKCFTSSNSSNDKLDYLLSRSLNNVNELNDNSNDLNKLDLNDNHEDNRKKNNDGNQLELIRRLSTPAFPNSQSEKDELKVNKKLSLKSRRSFSPKSKLIINQNSNKKLSLDQELLEHYNQLSTECSSSYMSLVSKYIRFDFFFVHLTTIFEYYFRQFTNFTPSQVDRPRHGSIDIKPVR